MIKGILIDTPPITTEPPIANMMSMLWVHKEKTLPWFSNYFIQLVASKHGMTGYTLPGNFYDNAPYFEVNMEFQCPFLEIKKTDRNTIYFVEEDLTKYVEYQIDRNQTIQLFLNFKYLKCSDDYGIRDYLHPVFITAYDSEKRTIYISDFFDGQKYQTREITYEEFNNAYLNCGDMDDLPYYYQTIIILKYRDFDYKFRPDLLIRSLNDYVNGVDSFDKYRYDWFRADDHVFGIQYYDQMIENIQRQVTGYVQFHVLYDHKVAMQLRLEYLFSNNYLSNADYHELSNLCKSLMNDSQIIRNKIVKYNISNENKIIIEAISKLNDLKSNDLWFSKKLISSISA